MPRQGNQVEGRIATYEFYVSDDGVNWGAPAKVGNLPFGSAETTVNFNQQAGRYIRFRPMGAHDGKPWATLAEINVLGRLPDGRPSPTPAPSPVDNLLGNGDFEQGKSDWLNLDPSKNRTILIDSATDVSVNVNEGVKTKMETPLKFIW